MFADEEGKTSLTGNLPVCLQGSCNGSKKEMEREKDCHIW